MPESQLQPAPPTSNRVPVPAADLNAPGVTAETTALRARLGGGTRESVASRTLAEQPAGGRDYALDAARGILMLLGVALHAASAYSRKGEWVVHDPENSVAFDWLLQAIHLFRMPSFFWISGYFFALTISRGKPTAVLRQRLFRLVLPLVATWLTFNVAQGWVIAVAHGKDPVDSVLHHRVPIGHLWFLLDLAIMTGVAALALWVPPRLVYKFMELVPRGMTVAGVLLALTAISTLTFLAARATGFAYVHVANVTSLGRLATYMPFFGIGAAMYHLPRIRRVFLTVPPLLIVVALPLGMYAQSFRDVRGVLAEIAAPVESLAIWTCVAIVLQFFYRIIRGETRFVKTLNDSSYSIYLFHHAIMVSLVLVLLRFSIGPFPKFLLACVISFAIAAAMHLFLVRKSRVLRFIFNGRLPARIPKPAGTAPATHTTPLSA